MASAGDGGDLMDVFGSAAPSSATIRRGNDAGPSTTTTRVGQNHSQGGGMTGSTSARPAVFTQATNARTMQVASVQKGNPLLKHLKTPYAFNSELLVDYETGAACGVLYLSIQYHLSAPEYIRERMRVLGDRYHRRILLIHVDKDNDMVDTPLEELNRVGVVEGFTVILAWSNEEAARYIDTVKAYEHRSADQLRERTDEDFGSKVSGVLTSISGVNKTDVMTLLASFHTVKELTNQTPTALASCPGIGGKKAKRLHEAMNQSFMK